MKTSIIVHMFWLFVIFYLYTFETVLYNFNVNNFKDLVGFRKQNILEIVVTFFIMFYAIYVIIYANDNKYIYIKLFLILIVTAYFFDALSSILLLNDENNKFYSWLYDTSFIATFYLQNMLGLLALYLLYLLIFS